MFPLSSSDQPASTPLRVDVLPSPAPAAARVRVCGELDLATVPRLRAELEALLHSGHCHLDLDLDKVTFCDVAGLNLLLRINAAAVAAGGRLVVRGSCPPLLLMLRVLHPEGAFVLASHNGEPADDQA